MLLASCLRNLCEIQGHRDIFPMVYSRNFKVMGFTFRAMIHFEVIFYIMQNMDWAFSPTPILMFNRSCTICWNDYTFFIRCFDIIVRNLLLIYIWICFWTLYFPINVYLYSFSNSGHCLDHYSLIIKSWNQVMWALQLYCILKNVLAVLSSLFAFSYNF